MSVINTQPLVGASGQSTGYTLSKSLRFRSSASAYLSRTPASAGNQQKWTYSAWLKLGNLAANGMTILSGGTSSRVALYLNTSAQLVTDVAGVGAFDTSSAVYRDPAAWYHLVWQFDTTQATAANRSRMYINGSQITLTQTNAWALNTNYNINNGTLQTIGTFANATTIYLYDGYMANVQFIDGQALTPSSFGATDTTTGAWQPIAYTGSYGTNGFYLPFTNTTSTATLGNDSSGNSNTWTVNNISLTAGATYDSMTDVPTLTSATAANYATLNPLFTNTGASNTFYYGNLELASNSNTVNSFAPSTIAMSSGKFYFEATAGLVNAVTGMSVGVYKLPILNGTNFYAQTNYRYYSVDGKVYDASTFVQTYNTYTNAAVIGVALDLTNGKVYFAKNNTWQGSSDPVAGTSPAATGLTGDWVFGLNVGNTNNDYAFANFGQQPFTYTPPSGYVALNTYNL